MRSFSSTRDATCSRHAVTQDLVGLACRYLISTRERRPIIHLSATNEASSGFWRRRQSDFFLLKMHLKRNTCSAQGASCQRSPTSQKRSNKCISVRLNKSVRLSAYGSTLSGRITSFCETGSSAVAEKNGARRIILRITLRAP